MFETRFFRELYGSYKKCDNNSRPSFSAFLGTGPFADEATRAMTEPMFFNAVLFQVHDPRDESERYTGRTERHQQCLDLSVKKFLILTPLSSNVGPVIVLKVNPATRVLRKRTNQVSALANDPQSATVSLHEETFFSSNYLKTPV